MTKSVDVFANTKGIVAENWRIELDGTWVRPMKWPFSLTGRTTREMLEAGELLPYESNLISKLEKARNGPFTTTCQKYANVAREAAGNFLEGKGLPAAHVFGSGGVIAKWDGINARPVQVRAEGDWFKDVGGFQGRQLCTMGAPLGEGGCFDLERPACSAKGPLRVYWYPARWAKKTGEGLARQKREWKGGDAPWPVELGQGTWLHPETWSTSGGSSGVIKVESPREACVFAIDPGSINRHGSGIDCGAFKWNELEHWTAAGASGRNHILIMPGCLQSCDHVGEHSCFGSIGEAMVASPSMWRGTFRPGFDFVLPQVGFN